MVSLTHKEVSKGCNNINAHDTFHNCTPFLSEAYYICQFTSQIVWGHSLKIIPFLTVNSTNVDCLLAEKLSASSPKEIQVKQ